jgi:hypothetical protein
MYIYVATPIPSFLPSPLNEICQKYTFYAAKNTHNKANSTI